MPACTHSVWQTSEAPETIITFILIKFAFPDVSQSRLLLTEKTVSAKLSSSIHSKCEHYPIALSPTLVPLDCAQGISSTALLDI